MNKKPNNYSIDPFAALGEVEIRAAERRGDGKDRAAHRIRRAN
jgi:hypothetical protein